MGSPPLASAPTGRCSGWSSTPLSPTGTCRTHPPYRRRRSGGPPGPVQSGSPESSLTSWPMPSNPGTGPWFWPPPTPARAGQSWSHCAGRTSDPTSPWTTAPSPGQAASSSEDQPPTQPDGNPNLTSRPAGRAFIAPSPSTSRPSTPCSPTASTSTAALARGSSPTPVVADPTSHSRPAASPASGNTRSCPPASIGPGRITAACASATCATPTPSGSSPSTYLSRPSPGGLAMPTRSSPCGCTSTPPPSSKTVTSPSNNSDSLPRRVSKAPDPTLTVPALGDRLGAGADLLSGRSRGARSLLVSAGRRARRVCQANDVPAVRKEA
jgi:hypothetical protein